MGKVLYLARHAKSDWSDPSLSDFDRPLNKRGFKDAPFMANILKKREIKLDIIISSPALRAKTTAEYYSDVLESGLIFDKGIYEASPISLLCLAQEMFDRCNSIMIVGHNPGLTMLNNKISNKYIDNMPTAGIVGIEFKDDITPYKGKGLFFEYPKLYKGKD